MHGSLASAPTPDWLVSADADYEAQTPVMRQVLDAKRAHPGAIVFFRLGDFYELFFEDALEVAPLLDMVLTSRNKKDARPIPMCGFPHHAMSGYVHKLVELGRPVAVVEQLEDPKTVKGIVKRGVTRVITPGVVLETEALDGRRANHLVALVPRRGGGVGLAAAEVSTGALQVGELLHPAGLATVLVRLEPREILLPAALRPWLEGVQGAREALWTLRDIPKDVARSRKQGPEAYAAAYLREYLAEVRPTSLGLLGEPAPLATVAHLRLDREAVTHLELIRTARHGRRDGALLAAVDRTVTAAGARALRALLLAPLADRRALLERHAAVEALLVHEGADVRATLAQASDLARTVGRAAAMMVTPRELSAARTTLQLLPTLRALLAPLAGATPRLAALAELLADGDPIADELAEALADEPRNQVGEGHVIRRGHCQELDELVELCEHSGAWVQRFQDAQRESLGIATAKVKYNRVAGWGIEVPRSKSHLMPDDYRRVQTLKHVERYTTVELQDFEQRLQRAEESRASRERTLYDALVVRFAERSATLRRIAGALAELDVHAGFAALAAERGYCRPALLPSGEPARVVLRGCRHPVVEQARSGFVPNDLSLGGDGARVLLLTGPNMAGKSTLMRQVALAAILAQAGGFVPAEHAELAVFDGVMTRIGASDDISEGASTFMVEMRETAGILRVAGPNTLVLLDEIGRGTSTWDGLAIAQAVVETLHDDAGALCLFATHYHELTGLERTLEHLQNAHVAVREHGDDIVFVHALQPGPTNRSHGITVARLAGIPTKVTQRARTLLADLERGAQPQGRQLSFFDAAPVSRPARQDAGRERSPSSPSTQRPEAASPPARPHEAAVVARLQELDPDALSPRQALDLLYELRDAANGSD